MSDLQNHENPPFAPNTQGRKVIGLKFVDIGLRGLPAFVSSDYPGNYACEIFTIEESVTGKGKFKHLDNIKGYYRLSWSKKENSNSYNSKKTAGRPIKELYLFFYPDNKVTYRFNAENSFTGNKQAEVMFNYISFPQNVTNGHIQPMLISNYPLNQILFGPPGTGKTFHTRHHALAIIKGQEVCEIKQAESQTLQQWFTDYCAQGYIEFVTFHQSFSYEDFVEGIKPELAAKQTDEKQNETLSEMPSTPHQGLHYHIADGVFKQLSQRAKANPQQNYVLIIDEINRGNIAQILGELITLLEEDKRLGQAHELLLTLPYSKERFGVPQNLYLIGTMNTADRSIEALDTALRRRFSFIEMPPDPTVLPNSPHIDLSRLLQTINDRLARLLGRDACIGHAFLMNINPQEPVPDLKAAFCNKIIPLLQEHFYGDWGKMGLVLGNLFIKEEQTQSAFHSSFSHHEIAQFTTSYQLTDSQHWNLSTFTSIYNGAVEQLP